VIQKWLCLCMPCRCQLSERDERFIYIRFLLFFLLSNVVVIGNHGRIEVEENLNIVGCSHFVVLEILSLGLKSSTNLWSYQFKDRFMLLFYQMEMRVDLYIRLCFVKWGGSAIYLLLVFYELERREHFLSCFCVFCGIPRAGAVDI